MELRLWIITVLHQRNLKQKIKSGINGMNAPTMQFCSIPRGEGSGGTGNINEGFGTYKNDLVHDLEDVGVVVS